MGRHGADGDEMTATPEEMLGAAMAALQSGGTGADAVLIGRPYLYGLALDGQRGTRKVMRSLVGTIVGELPVQRGGLGARMLLKRLADPTLLMHVWTKLLSNALKYPR